MINQGSGTVEADDGEELDRVAVERERRHEHDGRADSDEVVDRATAGQIPQISTGKHRGIHDESISRVNVQHWSLSVENEFLASMLAWERAPVLWPAATDASATQGERPIRGLVPAQKAHVA